MENEMEIELSLTEIFSILMKRLWLILMCVILCTLLAFAVSEYVIDEKYTASVSMYAAPSKQEADVLASLSELNYAQKVVNTYIEILKTNAFMESVVNKSGLGYTISEIKDIINIDTLNETQIFEVKVTTEDPQESFILANTIAQLAPEKIIEIKESDVVRVVDPAVIPKEPSSPNVLKNTVIGFALGFILGVMIAFLLEMIDKRVKNEDDILKHYNIPVLGKVPVIKDK